MNDIRIAVIGLGYVGLPLARLLSTKYPTLGFDLNQRRIESLMAGHDETMEVSDDLLRQAIVEHGFRCTTDETELRSYNFYIIAAPTPVDKYNQPDLTPLKEASETVGRAISEGDIVVYESTVYPGVTEDICVPVIEKTSGLLYNTDFFVGYSPERINPGDKKHTVENVRKVTSGSTKEVAQLVDSVYKSVITGGTHMASSIKVAEAAKVIENAQRDINIAFVNELAKIFGLMELDTHDVLEAASTKWNFLPFQPGLVGGHCIGVDPYYLAQCAQQHGYNPEIILAGRRMNDSMGKYVAEQVVRLMCKKGIEMQGARVLVMGFAFKENCSDCRNTKVADIVATLNEYNLDVTVFDPWVDSAIAWRDYAIKVVKEVPIERFDAMVLAVSHDEFRKHDTLSYLKDNHVIYDVKCLLSRSIIDARL